MTNDYEVLVAVHEVTEWRDGCIYKTQFVGHEWVPMGTPLYVIGVNNRQYVSLSTSYKGETIRRVRR